MQAAERPPAPARRPAPGLLARRFRFAVGASFRHAPLAALLALASAFAGGFVANASAYLTIGGFGLWPIWLVASHTAFVVFICAFVGTGGMPGTRLAPALQAARRGFPPMLAVTAMMIPLLLWAIPLLVVWWAPVCFLAVPARLIEHGWRGFARMSDPLPVPPSQRLALMLPSALFLLGLAMLLKDAPGGLMDGGVITLPLFGVLLFWAFYSAALFPANFAWEQPSAQPQTP